MLTHRMPCFESDVDGQSIVFLSAASNKHMVEGFSVSVHHSVHDHRFEAYATPLFLKIQLNACRGLNDMYDDEQLAVDHLPVDVAQPFPILVLLRDQRTRSFPVDLPNALEGGLLLDAEVATTQPVSMFIPLVLYGVQLVLPEAQLPLLDDVDE